MNPEERPFIPLEGFRFLARQLDSWCTDMPRPLRAGIEFPTHMHYDDLVTRLKKAAKTRRTFVKIWPAGNGVDYWVHFGKFHDDWKWR